MFNKLLITIIFTTILSVNLSEKAYALIYPINEIEPYNQSTCLDQQAEAWFKKNQIDLENFRDKGGNTALHAALKNGENTFAEKILEQHPQLVNVENLQNESPIYAAYKHGNMDGVKLCLEYHPISGSTDNNCYQIFEKVKTTKPYYVNKDDYRFYLPESGKNREKLVVILCMPDIHIKYPDGSLPKIEDNEWFNYFKKEDVPTLIIGNARHSLGYELIRKAIDTITLPKNIIVIIEGHGIINKDDGDHDIFLDNTYYHTKSKGLFAALSDIFGDISIDVLMLACHGGASIKDVDLLPKGSKLLVLSQADRTVSAWEASSILNFSGTLSLQHFLFSYLFSLKNTNNIPEIAISGGEKQFDYRELAKYFGYKLSMGQKNTIPDELRNYCLEADGCKKDILNAIEMIEKSNSIEDLKASEALYKDYYEDYLFPAFYGRDAKQEPCSAPTDPRFLEEFLADYLLSSPLTDFNVCKRLPSDSENTFCELNKPEKPLFGVAMATLYTMKKLGF